MSASNSAVWGRDVFDLAGKAVDVYCGDKCPITSGRALRMTRTAWDALCTSKRKDGMPYGQGPFGNQYLRKPYIRCEACKGTDIPPEITFIEAAEVAAIDQQIKRRQEQPDKNDEGANMAAKKRFFDCGVCGERANVFMNHGIEMCSTCANLYTHVRNRVGSVAFAAVSLGKANALLAGLVERAGAQWFFEAAVDVMLSAPLLDVTVDRGNAMVLALVERFGVDWFVRESQQYTAKAVKLVPGDAVYSVVDDAVNPPEIQDADGLLKQISALVGYEGDETEELVEKVAEVMVENQQLWKWREDYGRDGLAALQNVTDRLVRREAALWELVGAVDEIVADRDEVFKCYNELFTAIQQERKEHCDFRVDLCRVFTGVSLLPVPDDNGLIYLAAASEALLEHVQRAARALDMDVKQEDIPGLFARFAASSDMLREQTRFIVTLRDLLGMPVSHLGDMSATLTEKLELLAEYSATMDRTVDDMTRALRKQEEAEQQLLADEQIFAHLREVLGNDSLANGDLPTAVAALYAAQVGCPRRDNAQLDSCLLRLWLAHPDVGVEYIAEIREVA